MSEEREIPNGWANVELGQLCLDKEGLRRGPFGSAIKKEFFVEDGFKVYEQSNAIYDDVNRGKYFISEKKYQELINFNVQPDDLIVSCSGTLGKIAQIPKYAKQGVINQALLRIRLISEIIDTKYFLYFFRSAQFQRKIFDQSQGTAMSNLIGIKDFKLIGLLLPPLPEQHRIVAKIEALFSSLDKGIESLKTAQEQLKVYRQAVLKWAFEGKLTNKDVKDGELPEGWEKLTLGDIAIRNSLKAMPSEMPDAKFIGMDCIEPNTLKPFKFYEFKEFKSAGNVYRKNQVLYGRMRPYLNKVYKAEIDGACSGEFIVLDCLNGFNPELLKYNLHHRDFVSFANHKTTGDRPRISFEEIVDYPVNVCKPEEQQIIVSEIESRLSVCDKIEESITTSLQQAEALRQSILKKAFEGKLVEQDPNDEPADVLLERIASAKLSTRKAEKEKNNSKNINEKKMPKASNDYRTTKIHNPTTAKQSDNS